MAKFIINKNKGFTLLEVLIALMILAIVGAIVTVAVRTAVENQHRVRQKVASLQQLQLAVFTLEQDLRQIINRPIRVADGALLPAVMVTYPGGNLNLEFTKAGVAQQFKVNSSTLERVVYKLENKTLIRTSWQVLDRTFETSTVAKPLLTTIKSFNIEFMDVTKQFSVPAASTANVAMPLAIAFKLEIDGFGTVERIVTVAGGL